MNEEDDDDWREIDFVVPGVDYYAILNVDHQASGKEIKDAFVFLSREFHPDKQPNRTAEATEHFPIIDRAYKVLSNPILRKAYDDYGEVGLDAIENDEDLNVAIHQTTDYYGSTTLPMEITAKLIQQKIRRVQEEALHKQLSFMNANISIEVDAVDFVAHPLDGLKSLFRPGERYIGVDQMVLKQTLTLPHFYDSPLRTVVLGGYLVSNQGLSAGGVSVNCYQQFAHGTSGAVLCNLGWTPKVVAEVKQQLSQHASLALRSQVAEDGLDVTVIMQRMLSPTCQGSVSFGPFSGIKSDIQQSHRTYDTALSVDLAPHSLGFSTHYQRHLNAAHSTKVALHVDLLDDIRVEFSSKKWFHRLTRWGVSLAFGLKKGICLRLSYSRAHFRVTVPILLCPLTSQNAWAIVWASCSPFLISAIVEQLIQPHRQRKKKENMQEAKAKQIDYVTHARRTAWTQQKVMERQASIQYDKEVKGKGLVILQAYYGINPGIDAELKLVNHLPSSSSNDDDTNVAQDLYLDVTIPLRFYVKNSRLFLAHASKASLLGFYDPCMGYEPQTSRTPHLLPQLYVRYAFGDSVYEVSIKDSEPVLLPSKQASIMGKKDTVE